MQTNIEMFSVERLLAIVLLLISAPLVQSNMESVDNHVCMRSCEWPPKPRTCEYNFSIEWRYANDKDCQNDEGNCVRLNGAKRPVLVVNRSLPGPSIQVCEGDTIVVHVTNNMRDMESEGTTIHWHGIHQVGTPHMDGVSMITQCPILIHQTFTYKFIASPAGTHWWHSHAGLQRAEGVFGPLVVRQALQADPNRHQYDFDLPEHVVTVHDWFNKMVFPEYSRAFHNRVTLESDAILMNGKGKRLDMDETSYQHRAVFNVVQGKRYRFRVISSTIGYCYLKLSVDHHTLTVLATDGRSVKPFNTPAIVLHSAERFDIVLNAINKVGNYWFRVKGFEDCRGLEYSGIIHYSGAPEQNPKDEDDDFHDQSTTLNTCQTDQTVGNVGVTALTSAELYTAPTNADVTYYFGTQLDNKPSPGPTFNRISFKMPSHPLLTQSHDVSENDFCNTGNFSNCAKRSCECVNTIRAKQNQVTELVFMNEGAVLKCHPIHIHGHVFQVVAQEFLSEAITFKEFVQRDRDGLIPRKTDSAVLKDTVHIPLKGYLIVRFVADNPGWWFLHCHTEWHVSTGMAMVLHEGEEVPAPEGFPKCGSWRAEESMPPLSASSNLESNANPPLSVSSNLESNAMPPASSNVGTIDTKSSTNPEMSSTQMGLHVLVAIVSLICLSCLIYAAIRCRKRNSRTIAPDRISLLQNRSSTL